MSLDYPYYEELRRRNHAGALWWRVGDALYYLGSMGGVFATLALLVFVGDSAGLIGLAVSVAIFFIGVALKRRSYVLGQRDGIRVQDY